VSGVLHAAVSEHVPHGTHAMLDGERAPRGALNDPELLGRVLSDACSSVGATVLATHVRTFEPQGVTVLCELAESHASLHTYPEAGCYFVDVFTCGGLDARAALIAVQAALGGDVHVRTFGRGRR
jgi:S-adenosylmethionine decarboxylase proenzyme